MSISKSQLIAALSQNIPHEILINLLNEYQQIKRQFVLRKFQPTELNAARFSECVIRLLEHLDTGQYTPFGTSINSERVINKIPNNSNLQDSIRFFIPKLTRITLDFRNKRDVAHVGGEVSPNYSDSIFVVHCTDWILTELVRLFYCCSINEAKQIVASINQVQIPIVAEIDGFIRIQDTTLKANEKVLVVLYYKQPNKVTDVNIAQWIRYKNVSRLKTDILSKLDSEAMIHYEHGMCSLLPKGAAYVEKNISLELLC